MSPLPVTSGAALGLRPRAEKTAARTAQGFALSPRRSHPLPFFLPLARIHVYKASV